MVSGLDSAPKMYDTLHRWAISQRDAGNLDGAASAAQSMVREAGTMAQSRQACRLLADLHRQREDYPSAKLAAQHWAELSRRAVSADPTTERQVELLTALDELGELARQDQDHWTVLEAHGNHGRMAVLRQLAVEHDNPVALLTEQCYSLRRAGCAARELGSYEEARNLFAERLTVARLTCAGNPADRKLVALVAAALADLGDLLVRMGDRHAPDLLREELALRTWLESTGPLDATAKLQLAQCPAALTTMGIDTGQHRQIATGLLTELEAAGDLDIAGQMLLTSLHSA